MADLIVVYWRDIPAQVIVRKFERHRAHREQIERSVVLIGGQ